MDENRKKILEEKQEASSIFKDKKSSYPKRYPIDKPQGLKSCSMLKEVAAAFSSCVVLYCFVLREALCSVPCRAVLLLLVLCCAIPQRAVLFYAIPYPTVPCFLALPLRCCFLDSVAIPYRGDRLDLTSNPKWKKNAGTNDRIIWADHVVKIHRSDGKVRTPVHQIGKLKS